MKNKKQTPNRQVEISLFPKDSFEDLVLRGFCKKEIEEIMGCKFPSDFIYRKKLSNVKNSDLFKNNQKSYKLKYIKENFSKEDIISFFKLLSTSKITQEQYIYFGIKKGNRPNCVLVSDIFEYLEMSNEFSELVEFYKQKTSLKKYGTKFPQSSESVKQKTKDTFLKKYGVESILQSDEIKAKAKKTSIEHYGVEHPMKSQELKDARKKYWLEKEGVISNLQLDSTQNKIRSTNIEKYGVENPMQNEDVKKTREQTTFSTYGVSNVLQLKENREKMREAFIKKFGGPSPLCSPIVRDKANKTNLKRYGNESYCKTEACKENNLKKYGVQWPMQVEEILQVAQSARLESFNQKYGVDWPMEVEEFKIEAEENRNQKMLKDYGTKYPMQIQIPTHGSNLTPKQKAFETKRKNGTLNSSKPEDDLENVLKEHFGVVYRNYNKDYRYPFLCDFYIPSEDLFIELNLHWTHGGHEFNINNIEDLKTLEKWHQKAHQGSKYYSNAIKVWTERDKTKLQTARNNNINYLVFWNKKELEDWISTLKEGA